MHRLKRNIIERVNNLVVKFNENNKTIKDNSGKQPKNEQLYSEFIEKNKLIQEDCQSIQQAINDTKAKAAKIANRLSLIMSQEVLDSLNQKYAQKAELVDDCEKLKQKVEQQS